MCARVRRLACGLSNRMLDRRRVCSIVFLSAVVAAATAVGAPAALAASGDWRWEGRRHAPHAVRYDEGWDAVARSRTRVSRSGARRASDHHGLAATSVRRPRAASIYSTRPRAQAVRPALRSAVADLASETLPLEQRSLVASHPLLPGAALAGPSQLVPESAELLHRTTAPRCTSALPSAFALVVASFTRDFRASEPSMVEGAWPHCRGTWYPQTNWHEVSVGPAAHRETRSSASHEPSGWSINWRASASCLADPLRAVLDLVAEAFGPLTVNSTCRSPAHNRHVGGAPRSYHLTGNAVDFRVPSNYGEVHTFLKKMRKVGGLSHYGGGVFHIDTGPRRTWAPGSWQGARVRVARRG